MVRPPSGSAGVVSDGDVVEATPFAKQVCLAILTWCQAMSMLNCKRWVFIFVLLKGLVHSLTSTLYLHLESLLEAIWGARKLSLLLLGS